MRSQKAPVSTIIDSSEQTKSTDLATIRSFMGDPSLELTYIVTDLPQPYFMVGKVSELERGGGINIEQVENWKRTVNVYEQKDLIEDRCAVYEFHTNTRNNILTSVRIRNLKPTEIESLDAPCSEENNQMPAITKAEAETLAMGYLERALPNFKEIENEFIYSQKLGGESHEWKWEDKEYKLPEGLGGDPYSYPIIRIVIYGNRTILYENTTSLFESGIDNTLADQLKECLPKSDMASKGKCDELLAKITNFDECINAGFPVMESYPERCNTPDGRSFVNQ